MFSDSFAWEQTYHRQLFTFSVFIQLQKLDFINFSRSTLRGNVQQYRTSLIYMYLLSEQETEGNILKEILWIPKSHPNACKNKNMLFQSQLFMFRDKFFYKYCIHTCRSKPCCWLHKKSKLVMLHQYYVIFGQHVHAHWFSDHVVFVMSGNTAFWLVSQLAG